MSDPVMDAMSAMARENAAKRPDLEATGLVKIYGDRTVVNGMDVSCSCGDARQQCLYTGNWKCKIQYGTGIV